MCIPQGRHGSTCRLSLYCTQMHLIANIVNVFLEGSALKSHALAGISMFLFLQILFCFIFWPLFVSHLSMYFIKKKDTLEKKLQGNILKKHFPWSVLNVSTFSIYLIVFVCLFLFFYSRKQKITLILFLTMFSLMPCVDLVPKSCVAILSYCFCFALVNLWTSNKWLFLGLQQTL